jgi:hypothetical protein
LHRYVCTYISTSGYNWKIIQKKGTLQILPHVVCTQYLGTGRAIFRKPSFKIYHRTRLGYIYLIVRTGTRTRTRIINSQVTLLGTCLINYHTYFFSFFFFFLLLLSYHTESVSAVTDPDAAVVETSARLSLTPDSKFEYGLLGAGARVSWYHI